MSKKSKRPQSEKIAGEVLRFFAKLQLIQEGISAAIVSLVTLPTGKKIGEGHTNEVSPPLSVEQQLGKTPDSESAGIARAFFKILAFVITATFLYVVATCILVTREAVSRSVGKSAMRLMGTMLRLMQIRGILELVRRIQSHVTSYTQSHWEKTTRDRGSGTTKYLSIQETFRQKYGAEGRLQNTVSGDTVENAHTVRTSEDVQTLVQDVAPLKHIDTPLPDHLTQLRQDAMQTIHASIFADLMSGGHTNLDSALALAAMLLIAGTAVMSSGVSTTYRDLVAARHESNGIGIS